MSSINPETVVSVLKDQIENYDQKTELKEEGRIIQIADGIATVYGMDQAMYGELVIFETGVQVLMNCNMNPRIWHSSLALQFWAHLEIQS